MAPGAPSHYFCGQGRDRAADLPLVRRQPASIGGAKARNSWTCSTCSWGRTAATTVSLTSAPAPHDVARRRGHQMAIRTSRASGSWAATGQPARPGSVWAATPSREGAISAAAYGANQC